MPGQSKQVDATRQSFSQEEATRLLAGYFRRNGYVRRQNPKRLADEGYSKYKKGDEVRLVAKSQEELELIRRLLTETGFKPGSPFAKAKQICLPVYGRKAVARFLELVEAESDG